MNVQHPLKKINSFLRIKRYSARDINLDLFPSDVYPAFEEDTADRFEFEEL